MGSGLWSPSSGSIELPDKSNMMFLPQTAYIPDIPRSDNTLRNQVLFPHTLAVIDDEVIEDALRTVNLEHHLGPDGVHTSGDWRKTMSGGERQRLVLARLLVARPRMAFLDEATCALDTENERRLYDTLQNAGSTYVTVSHKPELRAYHTHVLELFENGGYKFKSASRRRRHD